MPLLNRSRKNRLGFIVLGLTNNFAYVIMLAAAYDLLKQAGGAPATGGQEIPAAAAAAATGAPGPSESYCNEHSTSAILLADTLPSLTVKLLYPFLLVGIPGDYKAIAVAFFTAVSFVMTGLSKSQPLIFTGVAFASLSSGLGETSFLSSTPLYGDSSLIGWSMGTGGAGLAGSAIYAVLRWLIPIESIMLLMLAAPALMLLSYFCIIEPLNGGAGAGSPTGAAADHQFAPIDASVAVLDRLNKRAGQQSQADSSPIASNSAAAAAAAASPSARQYGSVSLAPNDDQQPAREVLDFRTKLRILPTIAKYFFPLGLVYFAEYFINQGLFELIYFPNTTVAGLTLNHADQYSWFQVSYQLGVLISRSTLDCMKIRNILVMSLLQCANTLLFLGHTSKLIHIPSFYLVVAFIIYEGLLGGFTYVNAFYRVKREVPANRREFCISTCTLADTLGIVLAGLTSLPVHNALCKLYE